MPHNKEMENMALLYSYGELPQEQEAEFNQHLKECKECQQILFSAGVMRAALPSVDAPQFSPAFYTQPAKQPWFGFKGFSFKHLVPATVLAVFIFAGIAAYTAKVEHSVSAYKSSVTGMYSEVSSLEQEVDDMESYFANL